MQKSKMKRRTRPEPERTAPDRAWKRSPPKNGSASREAHGAAPEGNGAAPEGNGAVPPAAKGAAGTLNDAYRLVDEYLRQGQEMAENIWLPFGGKGAPAWPSPAAPERFLRAMGDMTLAWVEAMQGFTNASAAPTEQPSGSAGPFQAVSDPPSAAPSPTAAPASAAKPAPRPRELGVSVEAKGRVEVAAVLHELADAGALEASELRPAKGKAQPIREVSVSAEAERVLVRIVVPDTQPRGTYNGLLLDAKAQKPCGTLSVVVR